MTKKLVEFVHQKLLRKVEKDRKLLKSERKKSNGIINEGFSFLFFTRELSLFQIFMFVLYKFISLNFQMVSDA